MDKLKLHIKPDTSRLLTEINRFLAEKDIRSFIVGGFVRDLLLGRATADIDIAVAADALEIASRVADALGGKYIRLDDINLIGRVILPDKKQQVDFTTLQGDIEQDLARRDFTIDAMAIELNKSVTAPLDTGSIIDPYNGRLDLRKRLVRAVSDTIFRADAARLIRAVRIAAELDFTIEDATATLISNDSRLITGVAGERIREELMRLLALPGAGKRLFYLDKLGLLTALIPELSRAKGVEQPKVHTWDVFDHSVQTVAAAEFLLREATLEYADEEVLVPVPWSERLSRHFDREISSGSTGRTMLKLAALFHDLAKPQTKTTDDERTRFLGHPEEGAAMTVAIMERLRFSNREIQLVALLVKYHLRPTQMSGEGMPSHRAIYRYFRDTGEAGIDLLFLCLADHLATKGPSLDITDWREHTAMAEYVLSRHFAEESLAAPVKILDGHDVMKIFGLSPGPEVGRLLEALREAQAAGEVATREQAVAYLEHQLNKKSQSIRSKSTRREK
jgi:poly(A) polymerase